LEIYFNNYLIEVVLAYIFYIYILLLLWHIWEFV